MGGGERLRLFLGLPLPPDAVEQLVSWQGRELAAAGSVRLVSAENLHVTVAFLGSRPADEVGPVADAMRAVAATAEVPLVLRPVRYRETKSVGMVVLDDADGRAAALTQALWGALERLGVYERESRRWLAHVTVARFRERPRLAPAPPAFEPMSPSEVALYHSVLRRDGASYEVLESADLGG